MIYTRLTDIKTAIENTLIFPSGRVFLGEEFSISADNVPFCIIKSGFGDVDKRKVIATAYAMALFCDNTNIESTVNSNMKTVARNIANLPQIEVVAFTTDEDIFAPFGVVINPVPPYGGFRLDIKIEEVF
jgi:hypothetical protein